MQKTVSIAEARGSFSELVNRVAFGKESYIVERRGKPVAALVGAGEYRELTELLKTTGVMDEVCCIPVRVRFDGDIFFVSDDLVDQYGAGSTVEEAKREYKLNVEEYYADLLANKDRLVKPLCDHLTLLRKAMRKASK